jgi:hypothetical protein
VTSRYETRIAACLLKEIIDQLFESECEPPHSEISSLNFFVLFVPFAAIPVLFAVFAFFRGYPCLRPILAPKGFSPGLDDALDRPDSGDRDGPAAVGALIPRPRLKLGCLFQGTFSKHLTQG